MPPDDSAELSRRAQSVRLEAVWRRVRRRRRAGARATPTPVSAFPLTHSCRFAQTSLDLSELSAVRRAERIAKRREKPTNELECRRLFLAAYPHSSRSPPPSSSPSAACSRRLVSSSAHLRSLAHILHFKFKLSLVRLNSPNTIKMTKATRANRNKRLNLVALFVD